MTTNIEYPSPRSDTSSGDIRVSETARSAKGNIAPVLREMAAGVVVASLSLPLCVAAGVLAYGPLGQQYAATGAFAGIFCAAIGGLAAACVRRTSFITTIPTTPIAVIQASFIAVALVAAHGDRSVILLAIPVGVICTGLLQLLFAASGFSRIVKFVPHPVVAGFVTGIGFLIALHQVPLFLGTRSLSEIGQLTLSQFIDRSPILAFGCVIVASILVLKRALPTVPNLLVALLVGSAAFYVAHLINSNIDLGTTVGQFSDNNFNFSPGFDFSNWQALFANLPVLKLMAMCSLTLAIIGTLDTFFSLRTAQHLTDIRFHPPRELAGQAVGNLFSALIGGLIVSTSLSLTAANYEAGGRTRISTITSALVLLAGALLLPSLILSLPLVVLAAILIAASIRLIDRECIETIRFAFTAQTREGRLKARRDAATSLVVLLATVLGEPIAGVTVGFTLSCLIFLVDMSRPVITDKRDGSNIRSKRLRSAKETEFLRLHGGAIKILDLQGVLFFGNAYNLAEEVRDIEDASDIVILNCRKITNVDSSGWRFFGEIATRLQKQMKPLLLCNYSANWADNLTLMQSNQHAPSWQFFATLDEALEWAENRILDNRLGKVRLRQIPFEQTDLACEMNQAELVALMTSMSIERYEKGTLLCRKGDPSDRFWILTCGTVSVRLQDAGKTMRLATLGPGCTVGEMGFLKNRVRSADVYADDDVIAYALSAEKFEDLLENTPKVGHRLLICIARQLTQRVLDTSEELRAVIH